MDGGKAPPVGIPVTAYDRSLFWFRRDLRDTDNAGLYYALASSRQVFCAFVFDREILEGLPARADRRVEFIWRSVEELDRALRDRGGGMIVVPQDELEAAVARLP